jgi:ABC-type nickel/cobalt efflux system permease component RcnA
MTERHLIAYSILLILLIGAAALWRIARGPRRRRHAPEPHLRIDLLGDESDETIASKP